MDFFEFYSDLIHFSKKKKSEREREKGMPNFPLGARQGNTMGVLYPGGIQGIRRWAQAA